MIRNYLKTAFRNLWRNKAFSVINIVGLSVALACCMLILIHIKDELNFNKFNTRSGNIYRINWISKDNGGSTTFSQTPVPFSKDLTLKIPGIEKVAKLYQRSGEMESGKNEKPAATGIRRFQEQNLYFTDQDIFNIQQK